MTRAASSPSTSRVSTSYIAGTVVSLPRMPPGTRAPAAIRRWDAWRGVHEDSGQRIRSRSRHNQCRASQRPVTYEFSCIAMSRSTYSRSSPSPTAPRLEGSGLPWRRHDPLPVAGQGGFRTGVDSGRGAKDISRRNGQGCNSGEAQLFKKRADRLVPERIAKELARLVG